MCTAAFTVSL